MCPLPLQGNIFLLLMLASFKTFYKVIILHLVFSSKPRRGPKSSEPNWRWCTNWEFWQTNLIFLTNFFLWSVKLGGKRPCLNELQKEYCVKIKAIALHYVFISIAALQSFRLKLCSGKHIVHCTDNEWPWYPGAKLTVLVKALQSCMKLNTKHIKFWRNCR